MLKLTGTAAIALIAHSGLALAQPVIIGPDDGPRGRGERPSAMEPRGPGRGPDMERPERGEGPSRAQRGPQGEGQRAQDKSDEPGSARERTQAQRERQPEEMRKPDAQREQAQQQREQAQRDREQAQRERDQAQKAREQAQREQPSNRSSAEQAKPETGSPARQQAQPQQPATRSAPTDTARPATSPTDTQQPSSSAQRPDTTQPSSAGTTDSQSPTNRQATTGTALPEPERERIATTVREQVERQQIRPVSNLGVSVSVGAELPSRVQLQPLPSEIAAIRPQYRDYRFTVSEREIVIVDPRSRRIVEVIERDGRGRGDIYAVFEERRDVRRWRRPSNIVFETGVVLPPSAPYHDLPVELVERNPQWRGHQYVMTESEEIAIVEPRSHKIVEVVDKSGMRSASTGGGSTGSLARQPVAGGGDRHEIVQMILADARPGELNGIDALKGASLPDSIKLQAIPREVAERDRNLQGLEYALIGDDVLIVDPNTRQVVDVLE
jgi:hypothetical protein